MEGGLGKVDRDFLRRVLLRNLGAKNADILVGPGMGLDNAVLSIGAGRVMVITADPLSMIPSVGMEDSAWLTVHELASDLTTSAVKPQFTDDVALDRAIHAAAAALNKERCLHPLVNRRISA